MLWSREERKELFWTGFFAGAVVGGALGVFFASELGRRAYEQLGETARDLHGRFNGRGTPETEGAAQEDAAVTAERETPAPPTEGTESAT